MPNVDMIDFERTIKGLPESEKERFLIDLCYALMGDIDGRGYTYIDPARGPDPVDIADAVATVREILSLAD